VGARSHTVIRPGWRSFPSQGRACPFFFPSFLRLASPFRFLWSGQLRCGLSLFPTFKARRVRQILWREGLLSPTSRLFKMEYRIYRTIALSSPMLSLLRESRPSRPPFPQLTLAFLVVFLNARRPACLPSTVTPDQARFPRGSLSTVNFCFFDVALAPALFLTTPTGTPDPDKGLAGDLSRDLCHCNPSSQAFPLLPYRRPLRGFFPACLTFQF